MDRESRLGQSLWESCCSICLTASCIMQVWKKAQSFGLPAANKSAPENSPIVFLHGVGLGLVGLKPALQPPGHVSCMHWVHNTLQGSTNESRPKQKGLLPAFPCQMMLTHPKCFQGLCTRHAMQHSTDWSD